MRPLIAAMNMTLDGFCDHTYGKADDELHEHYNQMLRNSGLLLYGRTTYELMEAYWPTVVKNPTGVKAQDDFAVLIDDIDKVVFSHKLRQVSWKNARLATKSLEGEVLDLKQQPGKPISAGSPSLIAQLLNLGLVDELQICVQPTIAGKGLVLFRDISELIDLKFLKTEILSGTGSVIHYYHPTSKK